MELDDPWRRRFLQAIALSLGAAALPVAWADTVRAAAAVAGGGAERTLSWFTAAEAADVEAVAAQIIPTDDTPGAREAGVILFIDRALASFFSQIAGDYRTQIAAFQAACRARHPDAPSFASLASARQIELLETVDRTPFFETTRLLTLFGMFTLPAYGGNRDEVGWRLIGFEDRHMFQPPFGYYDRDYPGFTLAPAPTK